jgi:Zinc carboxypeptidase
MKTDLPEALVRLGSLSIAFVFALNAAVQTPEQYFGFRIGTDKKLVRYDKGIEYLQRLASESDRVRYRNLGPTTNGVPFVLLEISSAENLKNLDRYKQLERKLYFQGGAPTGAERDEIFSSGKAVIIITNNIHSTEIGSSQMVLELVHRLATEKSPYMDKLLDNVILLLVPSLNPDGQMMVTDWYNKYLGTPSEASPLPYLYHPYVGHDNNRDMYLFSQKESRMTADILWHDWFPSIWLDEHQQGMNGPRIFTMPATDPINPNVDPLIYRLNTIFGQSQAAALEAEGKTGIIFNATYTNFWEGAMAWSGWWHNQVGLLTEVASARIATPTMQLKADPSKPGTPAGNARAAATGPAGGASDFEAERRRSMERPDEPMPAPRDTNSRTEYPRPWMGGKWTLRDIVDYELIATFALLDTAAERRETLLKEIYEVNLKTIEAGKNGTIGEGKEKSYALLIPFAGQHDGDEAIEVIDKLMIGGVEVYRAKNDFTQDGAKYAAGTFVIPFTQVFARYAKDMMEKQTYPEVRRAPNAPAEAPYDVSAWSLGMQFGVKSDFAKTPLPGTLSLEKITSTPKFILAASKKGNSWSFPYNGALSALVVNRLMKAGAKVSLTKPGSDGIPLAIATATPEAWSKATAGFEVIAPATSLDKVPLLSTTLRTPRVAMYQSYDPSMDEGWTRWILEHYAFDLTSIHNEDIKAGKLRAKFDAIVLPDQRSKAILEGLDFKTIVPEYRGGIGDTGWQALRQFVADGGTLISLGESSNLLVDKLPLGVKELKRTTTREQHFAPGTIVNLQIDTNNPVGRGMAPDTFGFYINSPFFQVVEGFASQKVSVVARYPNTEVNASGWFRGEELMYGRAAVVSVEMNPGKIVLFGIRPQHRAQTHATLPLLFNALYWSVEGDLSTGGLQ